MSEGKRNKEIPVGLQLRSYPHHEVILKGGCKLE